MGKPSKHPAGTLQRPGGIVRWKIETVGFASGFMGLKKARAERKFMAEKMVEHYQAIADED